MGKMRPHMYSTFAMQNYDSRGKFMFQFSMDLHTIVIKSEKKTTF